MFNQFMQIAIDTAKQTSDDVPIGAVVVKGGEVIAKAFNKREKASDITSHAEILAIKKAAKVLNNWRLDDCELYVTLEPCPMCTWAILQSRINKIYFGSYNTKYGALGSATDLTKLSDHKPKIFSGIMEEECNRILEEFWQDRRC